MHCQIFSILEHRLRLLAFDNDTTKLLRAIQFCSMFLQVIEEISFVVKVIGIALIQCTNKVFGSVVKLQVLSQMLCPQELLLTNSTMMLSDIVVTFLMSA